MAKSLNDVLKLHSDALAGKRSSTTTALTTGENPGVDYADKMKDTRDFIAQHSVEKFDDRVGNGDDVYQATNVKKAKMERHGHEPKPKDIQVYNKNQQVSEEKEDMSGKTCKKCKKGKYVETSQHDDMKGVLHCSKCGSGTKRWALKEAKDEREYDYEGEMAVTKLKTIIRAAEHLIKMMEPNTNLPEWVQSKIIKAEDYITTAHDYLMSEMNEETELSEAKCNMSEAGKMCEVHGMKSCAKENKGKASDEQPMYNGKKKKGKQLILDKDIQEREMTAGEKKKEESLKDKYDDSDMKEKMKKQYGDKKGEQVYFAYIRKQAMQQESISDQRSSKRTSTEEARKEIYKAFLRKKERKEKMKEATTDTTNNYTVDGSNNLGFKL
jgi:hypothetical protein